MRFIRSQLRPQADWIGSEWVKIKNKVFQHMFRTGKLVEMTREKEKIWIRALVITEIRSQGDDRRKFLIKRCTISQNSSDLAEGKHLIVDICKIRPSPPRDLCAEYSLNDYVEVVVTHGWRKGRVTEILLENKYKVYFAATKEDAIFNYTEIRLSMEWLGGGSWIKAHESFKSNDTIALPKRISETGIEGVVLKRINKRSNLKLVGKVENVLGKEFKKLEDSFLAPVIKMGRRQKHMAFSRHLIHHLLVRRIDIGKKGLWFSFGEQLMRFSLREFHLATGLPCVVDKDEEEVETSATKKKKKDSWMNKNQTLNTLLKLLVEKSTELTADQRLRLGATILVEGILMASNPVTSIPEERLLRARNFIEFCKYPWGNLAFDYLRK
ncbi:unnamed protein product [Brassica oleracea var. botrytis]